MDVAGGAAIRAGILRAVGTRLRRVALVLMAAAVPVVSQSSFPAPAGALPAGIQQLAAEKRWTEMVDALRDVAPKDADIDYFYGSALANLGRWEEARLVFLAGRRLAPHDKRFPIELAGVAFKRKCYASSAVWLRRALRIDPEDSYANDFLGTVYFLEGNLEAALKYWNRVGKPQIRTVETDPPLRIRPALLDRALTFAPASMLPLPDLVTSQARVAGLEVFPVARFQLAARPGENFDLILDFQERNGWGSSPWEALLGTFSGLAYQTIYPAYFNMGGAAVNLTSLVRWDAQKRRIEAGLSAPLRQNPKWRYRIGTDLRNENWDIRDPLAGPAPPLGSLNLRREAGSVEAVAFNSGRWGWSAGFELSHRDYRNVLPGPALTSDFLLPGVQLKQYAGIHYDPLRWPEHRLVLSSAASYQVGRIWSQPAQAFAKVQGSLGVHWLPRSQGDDYETRVRTRAGGTAGQVPFDELYMLGMERDNDLWMRAHVGTRDGRKGNAPLGRRYFLANSEFDKNLYSNGLFTVKLGPFLDSGKITDPSGTLGVRKWMWDTGAQATVRVLGVGITFIYGKDLRTGNNAFYFTAGR